MSTAIAERKAFSIEPITYPVIAEKISELAAEYMPLRINGLDDAKGLKEVHAARMVVKNLRVNVDKRRKELKQASLEYGRMVDSAAKQLTDLLEPIENHLQGEEDAVENEKERIKAEAEEAKRLALQKRLDAMASFGIVGNPQLVEAMTPEAFDSYLSKCQDAFEESKRAEARAAENRRQEEAALKAERERLAAIQKQQDEDAARIRAEQHKLDIEKAKAEAAENARIETERRFAQEQERAKVAAEEKEAREKRLAEVKEAARLKAEAERPQREKLMAIADAVDKIDVPDGPGSDAVNAELERCAVQIRKIANGPLA